MIKTKQEILENYQQQLKLIDEIDTDSLDIKALYTWSGVRASVIVAIYEAEEAKKDLENA